MTVKARALPALACPCSICRWMQIVGDTTPPTACNLTCQGILAGSISPVFEGVDGSTGAGEAESPGAVSHQAFCNR